VRKKSVLLKGTAFSRAANALLQVRLQPLTVRFLQESTFSAPSSSMPECCKRFNHTQQKHEGFTQ